MLVLLATVGATHAASAQPVIGGFGDATIPARGQARIRIAGIFDEAHEQYGGVTGADGSKRLPLGTVFTLDSLGATRLPFLATAQRALRDSLGIGISLNVGSVTTSARRFVANVPIQAELGITRRFALGITLPIVSTRQSVNVSVNPGGATGNIGFNPASTSFSTAAVAAAANARNKQMLGQLQLAADSLQARVATCQMSGNATQPICAGVIRDPAGATALLKDAQRVAAGLRVLYGDGTAAGSPLVPIAGTALDRAIDARIGGLGLRFVNYQVVGLDSLARPASASARLAASGLNRIVADPQFGYSADSLGSVAIAGIGDISAEASFMWLDSFGTDPRRAVGGLRLRSTVSAGYRLATGAVEVPFDFFDIGTGSGANMVLVRSATDIAWSRRFWASVIVRAEQPLASTATLRVPATAGDFLVPIQREALVDRTGGRQLSIEATPRWVPTASFALSAHYALRSRQSDEYTTTATDSSGAPIDASVLNIGTGGRAQVLGFGATYSSVSAYEHGLTWLPAEVSFIRTTTIAGSGGIVPKVTSAQINVRIYTQIFGRRPRYAAPAPPPSVPAPSVTPLSSTPKPPVRQP